MTSVFGHKLTAADRQMGTGRPGGLLVIQAIETDKLTAKQIKAAGQTSEEDAPTIGFGTVPSGQQA